MITTVQRRKYLSENWITIRKVQGRYMVIDERYDTNQPVFDNLLEAIKHGERQIGIYSVEDYKQIFA